MAKLVLTAIGDDRAGLVSALASVVSEAGGNWLEGQMARLAGKFAGIVLVDIADERRAALVDAVSALEADAGLTVTVTDADSPAPAVAQGNSYVLSVVGNDRPGIVREFSTALADMGIGIEELRTGTREAPMSSGILFEADAVIAVPEGTSVETVRQGLEQISGDLVVDLDATDDDEQL